MNMRLAVALCIALILVGGATWQRATRTSATSGALSLAAVTPESSSTDAAGMQNVAIATTSINTEASSAPLTDTDLIGRQLFSQYVQLSANGQATQANLTTLANQYADNMAGLDKAPKAAAQDLRIVPDSHENLVAYGNKLTLIYDKYQALLANTLSQATAITGTGPEYSEITSNLSGMYAKEAAELESMAVPVSLADDHLSLINIYLGDAWGYRIISDIDTSDSATAFAGAAITNQNTAAETAVLSDIEKILTAHGI